MAAAAQLLLLCCLLQGSLSQNWGTFMPQSLEGLTGSCVMIPCTFSILPTYEDDLDDSCVAKWITGSKRETVFNSGQSANKNTLQGNLTGNLREKNCTTIFHNMSPKNSDKYFFRLECTGPLKFISDTNVQIPITDSLPEPLITATPAEVEEGAAVRLECSAAAPCPLLPPALTWTPAIGDVKENQQTAAVTSVMSFTASRLHNGQKLQCSALYRRQAGNTDLQYGNDLTLRVLYEHGPSAELPWMVIAVISLIVNIICMILLVFLWNTRKQVVPNQEDRTYMSLQRTDQSPEYDVIARPLN